MQNPAKLYAEFSQAGAGKRATAGLGVVAALAGALTIAAPDSAQAGGDIVTGHWYDANKMAELLEDNNLKTIFFTNSVAEKSTPGKGHALTETVYTINPETAEIYVWEGNGGLWDDTPEIGEHSTKYRVNLVGTDFQMNDFTRKPYFSEMHPLVADNEDFSKVGLDEALKICREKKYLGGEETFVCLNHNNAMRALVEDGAKPVFRFTVDGDNNEIRDFDGRALNTYFVERAYDGETVMHVMSSADKIGISVSIQSHADLHMTEYGFAYMKGNAPK